MVRLYFRLGLRMTFLERVCMGWRLRRGEGERLGEGGKGVGPNKPIDEEGC